MIVPDWLWYTLRILRGVVIVLTITSLITWRRAFQAAREWIAQED